MNNIKLEAPMMIDHFRFNLLYLTFLLCIGVGIAQETIVDWSPDTSLKLEDFKSPQTKINDRLNSIFLQSGVQIDMAFQMSNITFMFTKNFNSKITCSFHKDAASLMAPDSVKAQQLVRLTQFDFDLSELYTRKIRKQLYENKKAFSNVSFFQPYFDKMIAERNQVSSETYEASDFGNDSNYLEEKHAQVKREIQQLKDYCKECKPSKK
ncbi:MAG: hypothetical protein WBB24_08730 [Maribacter sp.]